MFNRVLFGALAAIVFIVAVIFRGWVLYTLGIVISVIPTIEMYQAMKSCGNKPFAFLGIVFSVSLIPVIVFLGEEAVIPITTLLIASTFVVFIFKKEHALNDIFSSIFPFAYPGALLIPLMMLLHDAQSGNVLPIFIMMIACAVFTDIFAFFAGTFWGRHKLCPHISPKKTIEGAIGGLAGSIVISVILALCLYPMFGMHMNIFLAILVGGFCGAVSQAGDLVASLIKRGVGIKDYGTILPGHGGILDRVDSVLFCAPFVYLILRIVFWINGTVV